MVLGSRGHGDGEVICSRFGRAVVVWKSSRAGHGFCNGDVVNGIVFPVRLEMGFALVVV